MFSYIIVVVHVITVQWMQTLSNMSSMHPPQPSPKIAAAAMPDGVRCAQGQNLAQKRHRKAEACYIFVLYT